MTVDAGAHMFSAMAFWQARAPGGALISNGLATMGYALPAAIARSLHCPDEQVIAFTGDGGLMMCAGELATAAQAAGKLCVVVFNDAALSLIALKQHDRGMRDAGVSWPQADFAAVARGFGMLAHRAHTQAEYEAALRQAFQCARPCLIDVRVDPSGYGRQAKALRG
nr:thiamine pyrophosphate-dependent enzyme [Bordetella sp. BOR01]